MPKANKPAKRKRVSRVSVRAEHHNQPDWDRFAFALLQYTKMRAKEPLKPKAQKGKRSP